MAKRVLLITYSLVENDAVGNDLRMQAAALRDAGYEVACYAQHTDHKNAKIILPQNEAIDLVRRPDTCVILHHSCYLPVLDTLLSNIQGPLIVRYHNITPPQYFPHNKHIQRDLLLGRKQCLTIVRSGKVSLYLGASTYNNQELIDLGADPTKAATLAPYHAIEDFKDIGINQALIDERRAGKRFEVLFVGRMMLHKGQHHLVEVVEKYLAMYGDESIRLTLVGKIENPHYGQMLETFINDRRLSSFVQVRQNVSYKDLHSYYLSSDVFLMMSDHEGFGVPILEAQYHRIPIVALERAAVRETLGPGQLAFGELDPVVMAAALRRVKNDAALRAQLIEGGLANYQKYSRDKISQSLKAHVAQCFA